MKTKTLLMLILFLILTALMAVPAFAGSESVVGTPEYEEIEGKEFFFANGTPITIESISEDKIADGAIIKWNGGEKQVGPDAYIFGGMHASTTVVPETNIVMNGGTVRVVLGGGLHTSNTTTANVTINGGVLGNVAGAGATTLVTKCGCTTKEPCNVKTANVTINGGKIKTAVYGAGYSGMTNTETANLTINGGDMSSAWVLATGSNGNTTNANLKITGGKFYIVQTLNRGTVTNVNVEVTGGIIPELFVGGDHRDSEVDATLSGSINFEVSGTAKVADLYLGSNGGEVIDVTDENSVVKAEDVVVVDGTVNNLTNLGTTVTPVYEVKIDGVSYLVKKGTTVKDIPEYATITVKEGYKFIGFTSEGVAWNEATPFDQNCELVTVFEKIEADDEAGKTVDEKDDEPTMGSMNTTTYAWIAVAAIALVGIATTKKSSKHSK